MSKYIETDKLKQMVEHEMDMQDTYLPAHFFDIVDDMPAADVVELRRGRWIYRQLPMPLSDGSKECVECSICHTHWDGEMNYCPNCGARMDSNAIQHTECVGNALDALDEMGRMSRYIDANKMADELSKVPWYEREDGEQAVRMVKEFSAADVQEVRHGRWLYDEYGWECSECGYPRARSQGKSAYCPNCGASMRSIDDEVADLPMEAYYNKDWKMGEVEE